MSKPLFERVKFRGFFLVRVNNDETDDQRFFLVDARKMKPVPASDRVRAEDGTETPGGRKAAEANILAVIEKIGAENIADPRDCAGYPAFSTAPNGAFWPKET